MGLSDRNWVMCGIYVVRAFYGRYFGVSYGWMCFFLLSFWFLSGDVLFLFISLYSILVHLLFRWLPWLLPGLTGCISLWLSISF